MLRKVLLSALMLGAFAVPAMAEESIHAHTGPGSGGAPRAEMKNPADTDGDGYLSKAEFMAVQEKRFADMDKDSDGKVSREENKAFREAKRAEFKEKRAEWKAKHEGEKHDAAPEAAPAE